ncbi:hypothetical protein F511_08323 [Dorcoceras hygrometricum]|uniref:Dystroglycan-like n=1 Tax=Dorcoceras hygrometricum TaxID=472368 RepID=A0A2Z7D820_9LAMI|nr:hypothetical protein F511_08323 [Dorcoceras hygrometricum]
MASALISNSQHISFDSVLAMDDAGLVAVFEALVATGLKDFLGCPAIYYEAALTEFFENGSVRDGIVVSTIRGMTVEISENVFAGAFQLPMDGLTDLSEVPKDLFFDARSIVSDSGEPVSISCKKREMKIEFLLLSDILAKTIFVKAGSFDAVTHERFLLMTAIISGVKINWSRLLFDILKDMATPGSRQDKGFAIQICVLLKNVPIVHRYVVINEKVSREEVADEPRVKKTPIKRAASKKRPAVAAATPVVKKKRTKKGKSVSSKENLEILPVAQEAVPLQIIEPTSAAITPVTVEVTGETVVEQESAVENVIEEQRRDTVFEEQPSVEVAVESVYVQRAETAVDISEEETVSVFEKSEPTVANVPVAESATEEVIPTSADDVDVIIEQVIAETAQMGADEEDLDIGGAIVSGSAVGSQVVEKADEFELWLNLSYEEFHSRQDEQPVVTASDTDEDIETIDAVTGVGDQQLQTFDTADSRTDASADYTMTEPVEEMEMAAVEQSADEAMSLEEILMTILVDCPLPSAEGEVTKIQLGISIPGVDEGDWYKASLPKIPATDKGKAPLEIVDPVKGNPAKEQFSLIVADIDLLVQLREQIIDEVDKFFNSFSLKKLAALQTYDISAKEELFLSWAEAESTRVALNRKTYILTKYRELLIWKFLEAHRANFVPGDGSSAIDLNILDKLSSLHLFLVEELKMEVQAHGLKWDRTCCSQIFEDRPRDRGAVIARTNSNTRSTCWIRTMILVDGVWVVEPCGDHWLMKKWWADICIDVAQFYVSGKLLPVGSINFFRDITVVEPVSVSGFRRPTITSWGWYQLGAVFARFCLFGGLHILDILNFVSSIAEDGAALRDVQSVNQSVFVSQNVQFIASSAVEDQHAEENHLNLSTQLGFLVDYINQGGDAKKGEGDSSRPQPPPDDQSRPSGGSGGRGSRPNVQSRYGGGTVFIESSDRGRSGSGSERRRPDDRSGHSKRRRSDIGESGMNSGLPPKRGYQWLLFGE